MAAVMGVVGGRRWEEGRDADIDRDMEGRKDDEEKEGRDRGSETTVGRESWGGGKWEDVARVGSPIVRVRVQLVAPSAFVHLYVIRQQ